MYDPDDVLSAWLIVTSRYLTGEQRGTTRTGTRPTNRPVFVSSKVRKQDGTYRLRAVREFDTNLGTIVCGLIIHIHRVSQSTVNVSRAT